MPKPFDDASEIEAQLRSRWPQLHVQVPPSLLPCLAGTVPETFQQEFDHAFDLLLNPHALVMQPYLPNNLPGVIARYWREEVDEEGDCPATIRQNESCLALVVAGALGLRIKLRVEEVTVAGRTVTVVHARPSRMPMLTRDLVLKVHEAVAQWHASRDWDGMLDEYRIELKLLGLSCC